MQEFGTHLVAAGIFALWFTIHYDQSRVFQWAMTITWALFALVHWIDVRDLRAEFWGPLITTVPFFVFAAVGVMRWRAGKTV